MKKLIFAVTASILFNTVQVNAIENDYKPNQSTEFKTYYNRSRGYKIDYPAFLVMGPASANADGRSFYTSGRTVELNVWSSYTDDSMNSLYNDDMYDDNYTITYKSYKSSWYVISGVNRANGKIFYKKVYYSNAAGEVRTMILEYPASRKSVIDPLISRIQQSFKDY
ncbi:MAG: hypothetical protein ACK4V4_07080 [Sphingobacteriales bacterium]|jgi:hypothetical protein